MIPFSAKLFGVLSLMLTSAMPSIASQSCDQATLLATASTLAKSHPEHVQVFFVAQSRAKNEIIGFRLAGSAQPAEATPAILLVAGLDGARSYTSAMALDHATRLAQGYGEDDAVTQLLDTTTLYIIPRLDTDAGAARSQSPLAVVTGTGHGVDNDRDGRNGEDGPSDVNGDGFIAMMRQLHAEGEWVEDPTDARVMIKADASKGVRGKWKLMTEGFDSDGDEQVAEDSALDAVANRNFPRNWTEHDAAAGRYPTHEPAALGLIEFLVQHPDIALVLTYGDESNLSQKPDSQDDGGASAGAVKTGVYKSDLPLYEELGSRYRELTSNETKGLGEQPGSFQSFAYHHRGLMCLDVDPWSVPLDAKLPKDEDEAETEDSATDAPSDEGNKPEKVKDKKKEDDKPKPSDDAKRLIWLDQNTDQAFLPWTAYEHPQLGAVEVGGFLPYSKVEPPATQMAEVTESHFAFLLTLGAYLPRLELHDVVGKALGNGLVEVTATLENGAFLPQQTRAAERSRAIRPARVSLSLPMDAELLAGSSQTLVRDLARLGGRQEFRWLVAGVSDEASIHIEVNTNNAGTTRAKVEVK